MSDAKQVALDLEVQARAKALASYLTMLQTKAAWLERPVERQEFYRAHSAALAECHADEDAYVAARRELIRWGVVARG